MALPCAGGAELDLNLNHRGYVTVTRWVGRIYSGSRWWGGRKAGARNRTSTSWMKVDEERERNNC